MSLPWKLPVMQAPIGPATTAELVTAVSSVGALGTLAASWTDPRTLRRQLRSIRASVGSQFCVNLVLHFDQRERLDVVLDEGAGFVSFSSDGGVEVTNETRVEVVPYAGGSPRVIARRAGEASWNR